MALSFGMAVALSQGSLGGKMKLESMMIILGGSGLAYRGEYGCNLSNRCCGSWLFEA